MEAYLCIERKLQKDFGPSISEALAEARDICQEEFYGMMEDLSLIYDEDNLEIQLYWNYKTARWEFIAKYDIAEDSGSPLNQAVDQGHAFGGTKVSSGPYVPGTEPVSAGV